MHTVLSAFDREEDASRAVEALLAEGYPRQNVHVERRSGAPRLDASVSERALASPEREVAVGPHAMSALDHFFDRLLGREHQHHARTYAEAVRRGASVVVVDTDSETAAERAVTIMREAGACDIAERMEQWRRDGWSAVSSGEQQLADGGLLRWRTAHVIHRASQPPVSELVAHQD
jgi:hypothetical protein